LSEELVYRRIINFADITHIRNIEKNTGEERKVGENSEFVDSGTFVDMKS
jgi:hypothetical protein